MSAISLHEARRRTAYTAEDELGQRPFAPLLDEEVAPTINAKPFIWRDPRTIPPRQFLYGRHYARKYVSGTVAQSGIGKSSLGMVEDLAMVTGRPLLGVRPVRPLKVWYWNGEDPEEEIERRFAAIMLHYEIEPREVEGRLFFGSGRDAPIVLATMGSNGAVIAEPVAEAVEQEILAKGIDCLVLDTFVSTHGVSENDNGAIDRVAKRWAKIAGRTNAAVELIHHVRKGQSGSGAELTVEDSRGAVALIGATRAMRVLNPMTVDEAAKGNVPPERRRLHFRIDSATGKANMAPPMEKAAWYQLVSVALGNGTDDDPEDHVGVVTEWNLPGVFDDVSTADLRAVQQAVNAKKWRADAQSKDWAGHAVAGVLELDLSEPAAKQKIKQILAAWTKNGMFREVQGTDAKRNPRTFLEVSEWA